MGPLVAVRLRNMFRHWLNASSRGVHLARVTGFALLGATICMNPNVNCY
jgi:hypothetical protein